MKPNPEDFKDWKNNPVTKWVFEELELMKKDYCVALGSGATLDSTSTQRTALMTAESVGFIAGIEAVTKIEIKE